MVQKNGRLLILFFFISFSTWGQSYDVKCKNMPLNELLVELRGRYDLQFSYDDRLLSNYRVTLRQTYSSADALLDDVISGLPLGWEKMGDVFVIFPVENPSLPTQYLIRGQILEKGSGEPLPFSHVVIDGHPLVTDLKGAFSYSARDDSLFDVKASHLGCYVLDTFLIAGSFHKLFLTPSVYSLPEIVVKDNLIERSVQIGQTSGLINLNSYIAGYLPGNGDNSVFNLLRLQPGITAAGEQPNDLIMWGSYEGTSRVTLDGITTWGLKNFNDNISAVNPFMVKSIDLFKGGYDATKEDLVGGIVRITGNTGNRSDTKLNFFANNQLVNGKVEVPISSKATLILAARHTYNNFFDAEDVAIDKLNSAENLKYKINVVPDYWFGDFNIKYSLHGDNGNLFYISALGASDNFKYNAYQERPRFIIHQEKYDKNKQGGASLYWSMNNGSGGRSHIKATWSELHSDYGIDRSIESIRFNILANRVDVKSQTMVREISLDYQYELAGNQLHQPAIGVEFFRNELNLTEDSSEVEYFSLSDAGNRIACFVQDEIFFAPRLTLKPGLRVNHSFFTGTTHIDPRFGVEWKPWSALKINMAWGSYHQFLIKSSLYDESGSFRYSWTLADEENVPVLRSQHFVAGAFWNQNNLSVSIEGYYKTVDGYTRFVRLRRINENVYDGEGRSYGVDVFVKKDLEDYNFWVSYTLGRSEELFPYFPEQDYRRAPHDQRHELKVAALARFLKKIHFSATYIYGSGFPLYSNYLSTNYIEPDYSRLDLALVYQFNFNKVKGEAGVSLLNALDHHNIKYSSFERIPLDQLNSIYVDAESVEFTPLVFVKVKF